MAIARVRTNGLVPSKFASSSKLRFQSVISLAVAMAARLVARIARRRHIRVIFFMTFPFLVDE